jgi:hypothetical protein
LLEPIPVVEAPLSAGSIDQDRAQRAALLKQSEQIKHFVASTDNQAAQPAKPADQSWQPAPQTTPPTPAVPKSPTDALLERALQQAQSHEEPPIATGKSKVWQRLSFVGIPAVVLALVIIGAHSFTSIELRVASAKIGFSASLPAYHPAGYTLGQLKYSTGVFASKFHNNNGQRYTITQGTTSWTTTDLLTNYINNTTPNYQVVRIGNLTVYLYGNGNATWVSHGIWYQINSDGSLNESELINVANSL